MKLVQPERLPTDGAVGVERNPKDETYTISVTTDGHEQRLKLSGFNAWRLVGTLSLLTRIPLSAAAKKAIKL